MPTSYINFVLYCLLQILGPPKKKGADFVSQMFKMAKESGAEAVEAGTSAGTSSSRGAFGGTAFRLGSDNTTSETVPSNEVTPNNT